MPAVRAGRVFAVDANAYFARPGPRVFEGLELLAHLIHPDRFAWTGPSGAFAPLRMPPVQHSASVATIRAAV
jgi:iron complex transport system substrate-binding protein